MKKLITAVLLLASLGTYSNFSSASISSTCNLPGESTYMWRFTCEILVFDEPDIPGLTSVKADHDATGDWWKNAIYQGSIGPLNSFDIGTITRKPQGGFGGPTIMNGNARSTTNVTKYLNAGQPNQSGITWNVVCMDGQFEGYLNGSWNHESSLDRFNCFFRTTE